MFSACAIASALQPPAREVHRTPGLASSALSPAAAPVAARRAAIAFGVSLPLLTSGQPADAFIGPLSSLGMRAAAKRQKECYDALECASDVPYCAPVQGSNPRRLRLTQWPPPCRGTDDIVCEREDTECLERKRRLASEALNGGPGFEVIAVFALFALGGPLNAVARAVRKVLNSGE